MKVYSYPERSTWASILARPSLEAQDLGQIVTAVLDEVRSEGDAALKRYTARFDHAELDHIALDTAELEAAEAQIPAALRQAMQTAAANISRFHEAQRSHGVEVETMPGVRCWRQSRPIEKVGLYIPGGTAPLFSTVLMLGIPAVLAGCREIVLCTPPDPQGNINPAIAYAARLVGISRVFKVGGIQAIAAMAFGTETVPRVYKIFGPGNQYVTAAKQAVSRLGVAIDMPAGPSEVLVCADHTANPDFVAADLLSQAEHGTDSQVVLIALEGCPVAAVQEAIERQLHALPRADIARQALLNSLAIVPKNRAEALDLINAYAPEHLILAIEHAEEMAGQVLNAGSVFLGNYTPESVGDYASGTNHTLPTNGFARAFSGVSLESFQKNITFQQLSREGLQALGPAVEAMAQAEQLEAHRQAVRIRLETK
jgi:histidinol dehydrogenase